MFIGVYNLYFKNSLGREPCSGATFSKTELLASGLAVHEQTQGRPGRIQQCLLKSSKPSYKIHVTKFMLQNSCYRSGWENTL